MKVDLISIVANGQQREVQFPCSVADFVNQCGWRPTQVVVEVNGAILSRHQLTNVQLHTGDRLEIIQPVAGG